MDMDMPVDTKVVTALAMTGWVEHALACAVCQNGLGIVGITLAPSRRDPARQGRPLCAVGERLGFAMLSLSVKVGREARGV